MAERKPIFLNTSGSFVFNQEMATTDTAQFGGLTLNGEIDMDGHKIINVANPSDDFDAANKAYVDAVAQGLDTKDSVRALSTTNVSSLSGAQTVDGVSLVSGDRVLLTGQTTGTQNGIWLVQTGAWIRPDDFLLDSHVSGAFTFVTEGTHDGEGWVCTNNVGTDVVATDVLTFTQFSGVSITAGAGLIKTGSTIDVELDTGAGAGAQTAGSGGGNSGLEFDTSGVGGKLRAAVNATAGLQRTSSGLGILLNGSTLLSGASGLSVKGLPLLFEVNGVATTGGVTATNLNTLTNGSNADSLHTHSHGQEDLAVVEAISAADPVYQSTTNNQVGKARADTDAKSYVQGIAKTSQPTPGSNATIVEAGLCTGVLSGATAGTNYYLQATGGIGTSLPSAGNRIVLIGWAKNATDLWVRITDYGRTAA